MHGILFAFAVSLIAWFSVAIALPTDTDAYGFFPNPDSSGDSDRAIFANINCSPKKAVSCEGEYKGELFIAEGPCYNCRFLEWANHESYTPNVPAQITQILRI